MSRSTRLFWSVVGLQAVFLLVWAGWHEHVRSAAPVVRLKTVPVDPQDLLRGDYMILRYEISSVPPPAPETPGAAAKEVWVLLEPRAGYHVAVGASWAPPVAGPGQFAVKGWRGKQGRVDYGIETYFVPEGKGTPRFTRLEVEAAVGPAHRLQIKRVLVDGRPYP
jgi:uncharacterized membrane-anchored protein